MAGAPPRQIVRDQNLDALSLAVKEWATKETLRLDNETKFMRAVMQGRGAAGAGLLNLEVASKLVQSTIDEFVVAMSGK